MKKMKKLLAVLLTVCLFSAPAPAQAQEQAAAAEENIGGALGSDFAQAQPQIAGAGKTTEGTIGSALPQTQTQSGNVAGEWKLTSGSASGMTLTPEQCGITEYKIVFNTDGTCSSRLSTINGAVEEDYGTWSQSGVMVTLTSQITGETVTLSLQSDGTLRALGDGTMLFFTRISSAPQTPDASGGGLLPPTGGTTPAPDTSAAGSFEGQWVLKSASANGQTLTPEQMGVQMTVTLNAGGTGTINDGTQTLPCTWTQNGTTANVIESDGTTNVFTMQADGTVNINIDGVILTMVRENNGAAPVNYPATDGQTAVGNGQTATGNGFTMQVPQGWMIINDATVQQLIQTYGQQAVDASGINNQLQYVKSMGILLYYSADFNSSVYVTQENAQGVTMDTFLSMEQTFASYYANSGMTGFDMAGPVDFSGKTYYTGTFGASNPMKLYYQIVNGVLYTVTLTGVSDTDAAMILGSFTVNG